MSNRDVDVRYDRDDTGKIVRAGASWGETRPFLEQFSIKAGMGSFVLLLGGFVYPPMLGFGIVGLLISLGVLFFLPAPERALYFQNDGRMITPHGIFYRPMSPQIGGHHDHIVSIEARMQRDQPNADAPNWDKMFEVIILSNGGDLIILSRNCHEGDALRAAAQLTHALNDIRRERGDAEPGSAWVEFS